MGFPDRRGSAGGLIATPLVVDGVLYLVGSYDRVFALNAVTGEQLWHYFYKLPQAGIPYGVSVRGIALGYGLVFLGTLDNHMVAIDAKTGKEVWDVEIEDTKVCGCNVTAAPLLINDKVVVGVTGGDSAHRGYLNAFDAKSGKHAWRFYTIPGAGEPGFETWAADSWKFGGGATWMIGTFDRVHQYAVLGHRQSIVRLLRRGSCGRQSLYRLDRGA